MLILRFLTVSVLFSFCKDRQVQEQVLVLSYIYGWREITSFLTPHPLSRQYHMSVSCCLVLFQENQPTDKQRKKQANRQRIFSNSLLSFIFSFSSSQVKLIRFIKNEIESALTLPYFVSVLSCLPVPFLCEHSVDV